MDPEACLLRAEEALNDSDHEECFDALSDYWRWRSRGGFEPTRGDARALQINLDLKASKREKRKKT